MRLISGTIEAMSALVALNPDQLHRFFLINTTRTHWGEDAKDQLIHTISRVDSRLFVVSATMGINSLEIIKHSESRTQTKACVPLRGHVHGAHTITMDFKMLIFPWLNKRSYIPPMRISVVL